MMPKRLSWLPLLTASLLACGGEPERPAPVSFASDKGRFSVLMPREPIEIGPGTSGKGDTSTTFAAPFVSVLYSVSFTDYPSAPADPAAFLLAQRDTQLKAPGKVVLERPVSLGDVPGYELRVHHTDGTEFHSRMYLRGARIYQQVVFGYPDSAFARRFFESFALR